jgi:predicted ester cyclase
MKQFILLSVLGLLMLVVPSHSSYSQNNEAKNIEMVETYWTEVWSKGNLQAVADFYHPNAKHGEDFTIEGFQKSVSSLREAFPDFKVTIKDIFATENRVVSEVTFTGTHTGK